MREKYKYIWKICLLCIWTCAVVSLITNHKLGLGGSPGLVVMGVDSCSNGHWFEFKHHIMFGHFFTYVYCKNYNDVCLKRQK